MKTIIYSFSKCLPIGSAGLPKGIRFKKSFMTLSGTPFVMGVSIMPGSIVFTLKTHILLLIFTYLLQGHHHSVYKRVTAGHRPRIGNFTLCRCIHISSPTCFLNQKSYEVGDRVEPTTLCTKCR